MVAQYTSSKQDLNNVKTAMSNNMSQALDLLTNATSNTTRKAAVVYNPVKLNILPYVNITLMDVRMDLIVITSYKSQRNFVY